MVKRIVAGNGDTIIRARGVASGRRLLELAMASGQAMAACSGVKVDQLRQELEAFRPCRSAQGSPNSQLGRAGIRR